MLNYILIPLGTMIVLAIGIAAIAMTWKLRAAQVVASQALREKEDFERRASAATVELAEAQRRIDQLKAACDRAKLGLRIGREVPSDVPDSLVQLLISHESDYVATTVVNNIELVLRLPCVQEEEIIQGVRLSNYDHGVPSGCHFGSDTRTITLVREEPVQLGPCVEEVRIIQAVHDCCWGGSWVGYMESVGGGSENKFENTYVVRRRLGRSDFIRRLTCENIDTMMSELRRCMEREQGQAQA